MSVIVRVLFLLVVSSVSVIQSAPCNNTDTSCIDCNDRNEPKFCEDLNTKTASVKITASYGTIKTVCCSNCFEYLFIAPYTQLHNLYKGYTIRVNQSQLPNIDCKRLPLPLFELHQVNAIIEEHLSSCTVNSNSDIMQMQAISIFIKDFLSRTCEFVSQHLYVLLICHLSLSYFRHPLNVVIQQ